MHKVSRVGTMLMANGTRRVVLIYNQVRVETDLLIHLRNLIQTPYLHSPPARFRQSERQPIHDIVIILGRNILLVQRFVVNCNMRQNEVEIE